MTSLFIHDPNPNGKNLILMLHGLGAEGASWGMQFPALSSAGYRPLAPDLPGFGKSYWIGKPWSIERVVEALVAEIHILTPDPMDVVGLSMGGVIAQRMAYLYPQMVRKLVLVSTFSNFKPSSGSEWGYFLRRFLSVMMIGLPTQAKIVAMRVFPRPDQEELRDLLVQAITRADPRVYRAAMRALFFFDSRRWLKDVEMNTLIVSGSSDTTIPPARQKALVDLVPNSKYVEIKGGGHAVNVDRADEFNAHLIEFLNG